MLLSSRRALFASVIGLAFVGSVVAESTQPVKYLRFQHGDTISYGVLEGDRVRHITGDLFGSWQRSDKTTPLSEVKILTPTAPSKVLALAGNYRSHLNEDQPAPEHPEIFFKVPSCLVPNGANVVIPPGTKDVHFEAELVIVIGKRARNVSPEDAGKYILGVTCGNDISARDWQKNDVQWWRAKGSDTFGPCGPFILSGVNYDDLTLKLRLNGEVKQEANTGDMIHNIPTAVSWISQHVTLEPGDLIFTGTPGTTSGIKPGDVMEVELSGVGVLKNKVVEGR